MPDIGLTHVALAVTNLERSLAFYARYAAMEIIHRREGAAWISDRTRAFAIVLIEGDDVGAPLGPFSHLGVACATRQEVDRRCANARAEGCLRREPVQSDGPAGYWAFLDDPDGHTLELTYGQEVDRAVAGVDPARGGEGPQ